MKTAFKVMNVLMIIASAVMAVIGVGIMVDTNGLFRLLFGTTTDFTGGFLGIIGTIAFFFVIGVIAIAIIIAVTMLLTGVNGLRGYTEKCTEYAIRLIAFAAVYLFITIKLELSKVLPVLILIFFGIYFSIAKQEDQR